MLTEYFARESQENNPRPWLHRRRMLLGTQFSKRLSLKQLKAATLVPGTAVFAASLSESEVVVHEPNATVAAITVA